MTRWAGKRYWLVGASAGLGAALAHRMSAQGCALVLSARDGRALQALADGLPGPAEICVMDVGDADTVRAAAARVGPVDGIVYLAGVYWPMRAQDWSVEEANEMADINFTGLVRVLGHVVPQMVARDRGHIVVIGSLSGYRGLPGAVGYAAAKAGAMVLAQCLHADLRRTGVRVQLANPGFIRTRLTEKNDFAMPFMMEPDQAARHVLAHMRSRRFQRGFPAPFNWLFRLAGVLPDAMYYRLF